RRASSKCWTATRCAERAKALRPPSRPYRTACPHRSARPALWGGGPARGGAWVAPRLVPPLGSARGMGEALAALGTRFGLAALQRRHQAGVELQAPLAQQPAVGHLERQRVREGVLGLGEQPALVEELARLESAKAVP